MYDGSELSKQSNNHIVFDLKCNNQIYARECYKNDDWQNGDTKTHGKDIDHR